MSFREKLFGKEKKEKNLCVTATGNIGPELAPEGNQTTLRKVNETLVRPRQKENPELSALEMAQTKAWEIKTLPVWEPGDTILNTYEVEGVVSGGMGHVYIARHNIWNVKLAIKSPNAQMLSDRDFFARILREANSWTELGLHPNVAYCYYIRNIDDIPHIVVEYVDGGNLRQWIEDGKCIDYRVSLDLAIQFCHGIEHAHSKGMIHRDIKPENILMTRDGILKITDFGLVRGDGTAPIPAGDGQGMPNQSESSGLTSAGTLMGTEGYISPEQAESAGDVDERADIFSFGVCLYEMFCGNKPYDISYGPRQEAPNPDELSGDENLPDDIMTVLKRSVQWDPSARYKNFKEVRQELSRIYADLYGEQSSYAELELLDLEADGLNNRGVAYFELGRKKDAIECWKETLKLNQIHPETTYNLSLVQWRHATITDAEVLRRLNNCKNNPSSDKDRLAELEAHIHAERYAPDAVQGVLKSLPGKYEELFSKKDIGSIKCVRTMQGHTSTVTSVALTPDSRHAVSGSIDKTLRMWELETGHCLRTMQGHTKSVESVSLTPDGRYAISGSADKTLRMWDLETGDCLRTMQGHTKSVESVSLTPDGRYAISGSSDNTLRMWDLETGDCLHTMPGHTKFVMSVSLTPDGRYAISGSADNTLRMWDLATGQCLRTIEGRSSSFSAVCMTPDGRSAVSGGADKTLRIWDLETGHCLRTMQGPTISSVSITPDLRYAVSGCLDKTCRIWNLDTGQCLRSMEGHTDYIKSVAISPDGRYVVSAGFDDTCRMWEIEIGKSYRAEPMLSLPKSFEQRQKEEESLSEAIHKAEEFFKKEDYRQSFAILYKTWEDAGFSQNAEINRLYLGLIKKGRIKDLSFSFQKKLVAGQTRFRSVSLTPDGRYAVSGGQDGTLQMWELETGQCLRTIEGHSKSVGSVSLTPDGRYAISGSSDNTLRMWDLETGQCLRTMEGHSREVGSVALTPDARHAVSGSSDKTLKVWDLETGQCLRTMGGLNSIFSAVAITSDGRYAVSGNLDGTLGIWDLETGQHLQTMKGHTFGVNSVFPTPDNRYVVSGSTDKTCRIWDLETGRCLRTMQGHTNAVSSVALTPDARYAVSGSYDKTCRIWDLESGQCLRTMEGHTNVVSSVAITPDGRYAVSASADSTLRVWELIWGLEFD